MNETGIKTDDKVPQKRLKKNITMPEAYWKVLQQKQDGVLIRTYGDAIISILDLCYKNNIPLK